MRRIALMAAALVCLVALILVFVQGGCGARLARSATRGASGGTTVGRWEYTPQAPEVVDSRARVHPGRWPSYASVPSIDLQSVLATGGGGGGGGGAQSPFAADNREAGPVARGPHEFVLRPGEELWVIERRVDPATGGSELPGCGALMAQPIVNQPVGAQASDYYSPELVRESTGQPFGIPVPLKHTDVDARIDGYISTVRVTQQFENPFSQTIEAVYVFPLPEDAAVSDFLMTIGERRIRGVIREREEARRVYESARAQGHAASLLTQERPNIFTQHVANIEPGRGIDITMTYFNALAYQDGWFEWVFPMVVGPRFNPPCAANGAPFRSGVGAVERGAWGASGQPTEVQYLPPRERSGHDIAVRLAINAGVPIESVECRSH